LKRKLQLVGGTGVKPVSAPWILSLGRLKVSVIDAGDGSASQRFVEALIEAGAVCLDADTERTADFSIVIRAAPLTPDGRLRAEVLEEGADLVLGSARPVFAELFGSTCARWVNG